VSSSVGSKAFSTKQATMLPCRINEIAGIGCTTAYGRRNLFRDAGAAPRRERASGGSLVTDKMVLAPIRVNGDRWVVLGF
jgi:hypothetical protein